MAISFSAALGRRHLLVATLAASLLAGCATRPGGRPVAPGAPKVNRVAVLVPMSGGDAVVGQALGNAARLALFDSKSTAFELSLFDTAEAGAAVAASRAIAGGNDLILGPLLSEDVRQVTPIAQRARVPVIAFSNDASAAAPGTHILGFTPNQAIERVVAQAASSGARRFAALVPTSTYGQRSAQAFAVAVQRAGGQVVGIETYARSEDARGAARRLGSRPYDAVLVADSPRSAALAAPAIRSGARILGTELWASGNPGSTARLRGSWYAAPTQGRWSQFVQRYRARYSSAAPPRIASLGYDSVLLAVRASRNWPVGRRFPVGAIADREGFAGVDGIFRFRSDNVAQRAFEVRSVTATGSTLVSPAPTSFP
ncbi:penicillin-binding protein activator [Sphingomonas swuensis]|uniref:Penicillin-binding protein activator n=1 Tax=Sphingomonas swuensis TaxID=977800 RepID=A0ABP7SJR9_9SPHN